MIRAIITVVAVFALQIAIAQTSFYVNPASGDDSNVGSKEKPFKTLLTASKRVNESKGTEAVTIFLAPGIYALDETVTFKPISRSFTKTARLTIRAELMPDDADWNTGSMPTIINTMPLSEMWMGRKDPFGGVAYGFMVETSHISFQGLKLLGIPVVEHPKQGYIQRVYPIGRLNPELDDLEISQCLFAGDEVTSPNHLGVLATGTGIALDHCVFYKLKLGIVYWTGKSKGHSMTNCFIYGGYGCGIWTSAIANDFIFDNNVIANSNYVWISQLGRDPGQQEANKNTAQKTEPILYQVKNSLFAGNRKLVGTGGGPALNFKDVEPTMLNLVNTVQMATPVELELDQTKRDFLHPIEGSQAASYKAGLFKKPIIRTSPSVLEIKQENPSVTIGTGKVDGHWTGTVGGQFDVAYDFKLEGEKLTGTTKGPDGNTMTVNNGTIKGDDVTYSIEFNGSAMVHKGKLIGNVMKLTVNMGGNDMVIELKKEEK